MRRSPLFALATIVIALGSILRAQQSTPLASASLRLVRRPAKAIQVSVTNRYTRPITGISFSVGGSGFSFHFTGHRSGAAPVPNATILAGETRALLLRIADSDPATASAAVSAVLFEDGRAEGLAAAQGELADMQRAGPRDAPPAARPDGRVFTDAAVTSVAVASQPRAATDFVMVLENQRDVPIRAWSYGEMENTLISARLVSAQSACLCDTGGSSGLIQPHETRDIASLAAERYADTGPPVIVLTAVLWEDRVLEGAATFGSELLQMRARSGCR